MCYQYHCLLVKCKIMIPFTSSIDINIKSKIKMSLVQPIYIKYVLSILKLFDYSSFYIYINFFNENYNNKGKGSFYCACEYICFLFGVRSFSPSIPIYTNNRFLRNQISTHVQRVTFKLIINLSNIIKEM